MKNEKIVKKLLNIEKKLNAIDSLFSIIIDKRDALRAKKAKLSSKLGLKTDKDILKIKALIDSFKDDD